MYGQCRFAVVAMAFKWQEFRFPMAVWKYHIVNTKWWRIFVYCMQTVVLTVLLFVQGDKYGCRLLYEDCGTDCVVICTGR